MMDAPLVALILNTKPTAGLTNKRELMYLDETSTKSCALPE